MLLRVSKNLYVGNKEGLVFTNKKEWFIIHACQSYHYKLMKWDRVNNKPNKNHPNYLVFENNLEVSLNWVDGPSRLYEWYGPNLFSHLLDLIDNNIISKKIFIHCDCGKSRSPTLALLYLAKRTKEISNNSYELAYNDFIKRYPQYKPGGISLYVSVFWNKIN